MSHLRTIESLALPQRCRIHLVEVDGRQVLVAADAAGIKSVTVMPDRFGQLLDVTDEEAETAVAATTNRRPAAEPRVTEATGAIRRHVQAAAAIEAGPARTRSHAARNCRTSASVMPTHDHAASAAKAAAASASSVSGRQAAVGD